MTADRRSTVIVLALATASAVASLLNGFTFDDFTIVVTNPRVHSLAHWWTLFGQSYWPPDQGSTLYRPMTMLGFAAEWAMGAGSPFVFHCVNVLLYLAVVLAVLSLARRLLSPIGAFAAAALFAVHPVHVEAVGSVVGQSELLAALATIAAVILYADLRAGKRDGLGPISAILLLYAVGCLAKENAIVLPGLLGAGELTVWRDLPPGRARHLRRPMWLALVAIACLELFVRGRVIGDVIGDNQNVVLGALSLGGRALTMVGVVTEWARLLLWPATLSPAYSPQYIHVASSVDVRVLAGLLILAVASTVAWICRRRRPVVTLGIGWIAIAILPVSNILFVSGVIVAERTLFLPSVGLVLALGAAAEVIDHRTRRSSMHVVGAIVMGVLVMLGVVRSAIRERDWRSNGALLTAAIRSMPASYEVNRLYAQYLLDRGAAGTAEEWLLRAIALYPDDPELQVDLGGMYSKMQRCDAATPAYERALRMAPDQPGARAGLIVCLLRENRFREARSQAVIGLSRGRETEVFRQLLSVGDSLAERRDTSAPRSRQ